jgi:hypothetical protein
MTQLLPKAALLTGLFLSNLTWPPHNIATSAADVFTVCLWGTEPASTAMKAAIQRVMSHSVIIIGLRPTIAAARSWTNG